MSLNLLHIDASINSARGQSSQLARQFVESYLNHHPDTRIVHRDLAIESVPHLDADRFGAFVTPKELRTPAQQAVVDYSDVLIAELRSADLLVIGRPITRAPDPGAAAAAIAASLRRLNVARDPA